MKSQNFFALEDDCQSELDSSLPTSSYLNRSLRSIDAAKTISNVKLRLSSSERRNSMRHLTDLAAKVIGPENFEPKSCILRDISETGVRIEFEEPIPAMPRLVQLHIHELHVIIKCAPMWLNHCEAGLMFVFGNTTR